MRTIAKGPEPAALLEWKNANGPAPQNLHYQNLDGPTKNAIKNALIAEQGSLCGYTLVRLKNVDACHIEHIEPQNQSQGRTLDYDNMIGCFPKDGGDRSHGYGAPIKAGTHVTVATFVSPLSANVESRFEYTTEGVISPVIGDTAALTTIKTLGLNAPSLVELRAAALNAAGLTRTSDNPVSPAQAAVLAQQIRVPRNGMLPEFCECLYQAAVRRSAQPY